MGHIWWVWARHARPIRPMIMALIAGCTSPGEPMPEVQSATVTAVPAQSLESLRDSREQWLRGLRAGQLLADTTVPIAVAQAGSAAAQTSSAYYYSMEASHDGRLYQYIQGVYPLTRAFYGLYFEDGKLTGLILDQDVVIFFYCEQYYRHGGYQPAYRRKTPAPYRIERVNEWISQHDRLGTDFDAGRIDESGDVHEGSKGINDLQQSGLADAVEVIVHVPIAVMAAPIYGVSKLSPLRRVFEKLERERAAKRQHWADTARGLHPGPLTDDELLQAMGPPVSKFSWPGGQGWNYSWPDDPDTLSFGIGNGLVKWKVVSAGDTPASMSARPTQDDCGDMRVTIN